MQTNIIHCLNARLSSPIIFNFSPVNIHTCILPRLSCTSPKTHLVTAQLLLKPLLSIRTSNMTSHL